MLFRPVYGPELAAIHACIVHQDQPVSRSRIYDRVLSVNANEGDTSTQNVDDAISFLVAAHLITGKNDFRAAPLAPAVSFRLHVLRQLQALATGDLQAHNEIDRLYLTILDSLFIKSNILSVTDLHAEVNRLRSVSDLGGISHEKVRSWKRVMTYLGIGRRIGQGFQCVFSPQLLLDILHASAYDEGYLQDFLEQHLADYLPHLSSKGELALAVQQPLLYLMAEGKLTMSARQDSSTKPYFGQRRFRYVIYHEDS